ncbi:MAG: hypothetical protein AVDCRST_MAG66-4613 [uncultured Pseudonocardia sp.]|uniref:Phosphoserine phosphatase n=1 Tax=uncultured Pseudonocardia sp. TaxID=211455 RepID=A0A6J4QSH3_9PSEU|nr:MAG: hypothetical protein AVDCRST_MAG66-4613 [uncultured Pseudonocardia sp.]
MMSPPSSNGDLRADATFIVDPVRCRPALSCFLKFWAERGPSARALLGRISDLDSELARGTDPTAVHRHYCQLLAGVPESCIEEHGRQWAELMAATSPLFSSLRRAARAPLRGSAGVHLVSDTLGGVAVALMRELGADTVISTRAVVDDRGRLTGEIAGPVVKGGQDGTLRQFADARHLDLSQSRAWGICFGDLPVLESVGYPGVVDPDPSLRSIAHAEGWPVAVSAELTQTVNGARSRG